MPASRQRYILGNRYWLLREEVNKAEASRLAKKERSNGNKARIEKIERGNYKVWTTRRWPTSK